MAIVKVFSEDGTIINTFDTKKYGIEFDDVGYVPDDGRMPAGQLCNDIINAAMEADYVTNGGKFIDEEHGDYPGDDGGDDEEGDFDVGEKR